MFPIKNNLKQGDAFSSLLFNFDLYYIRVFGRVGNWKLNSIYLLMVYADGVYTRILGERIYMMKKNTETLVALSKETG
jgi:hypothetical protein